MPGTCSKIPFGPWRPNTVLGQATPVGREVRGMFGFHPSWKPMKNESPAPKTEAPAVPSILGLKAR